MGAISFTVILAFLLIGLLDSTRLRYHDVLPNGEVNEHASLLSVLDIMLTPLRLQTEKPIQNLLHIQPMRKK